MVVIVAYLHTNDGTLRLLSEEHRSILCAAFPNVLEDRPLQREKKFTEIHDIIPQSV